MTDHYSLGLDDMAVFAMVVEAGSFTAAARRLGMRKSTVSRRVSDLEARLELLLLHRTTRQLRLTESGERFYARCARVVAEARTAEEELREERSAPHGTLRVSTTPHLAERMLPPVVAAYLARYPGMEVEVSATWGRVDLLGQGFDLVLRVGPLTDSSLRSRALGTARVAYCASPAYLRAHGTPHTPQQLRAHACVVLSDGEPQVAWPFSGPRGRTTTVPVLGRLRVNTFALAYQAVIDGVGIGRFPEPIVTEDLAAGRLVEVLASYVPPSMPIHAVYPGSRLGTPKVNAFLELLTQPLQAQPSWMSSAPG